MPLHLESLARACREALAKGDTPAAREQVAALLAAALRDPAFVQEQFAAPVGERKIVYEDPQSGLCILAHEYAHAREGTPHDHGPSWAIYGQAEGESVMTEFELVEAGIVRELRSYTMRAGDARVYNEGVIHAVRHPGPSRLVRIEGTDLAKVKRGTYFLPNPMRAAPSV
jgi:hypothetical protein